MVEMVLCRSTRIRILHQITRVHCNVNQKETDVWFIIGVLECRAERRCKIPLGKTIFFAYDIECSKIENKLNTD